MKIAIVGGCGFVGLNLAEQALTAGHLVTLLDRSPPPAEAADAWRKLPGRLHAVQGDVRDPAAVERVIQPGTDLLVLAAAITADAARDAREPEAILEVNLSSQVPLLRRAREAGVGRVVNLSSGSAYGSAAFEPGTLAEDGRAEPESLYAVTKLASERVLARLSGLWGLSAVSVRLSALFGPWERDTGVRDTLSPPGQILKLAAERKPAILPRPGLRDWIYAPDVAAALLRLAEAPNLRHGLYNVTSPHVWSALAWGEALVSRVPDFVCRHAEPGEEPTVNLHGDRDRAPLDGNRLAGELGWHASFGMTGALQHLLSHPGAPRLGGIGR